MEINSTKFPNLSGRRARGIHFTQHRHCTGLLLRLDRSPSHGKNADKVNTATVFFLQMSKVFVHRIARPWRKFYPWHHLVSTLNTWAGMENMGLANVATCGTSSPLSLSLSLSFLDLNKCGR